METLHAAAAEGWSRMTTRRTPPAERALGRTLLPPCPGVRLWHVRQRRPDELDALFNRGEATKHFPLGSALQVAVVQTDTTRRWHPLSLAVASETMLGRCAVSGR
jgi:hypothetical protein